jgi:tripartite-type tricarboxylate transporter receptor subunit TctC
VGSDPAGLTRCRDLGFSGKIKGCVVTTTTRIPQLPDLPMAREAGLGRFALTIRSGAGCGRPTGVPKPVLDQLLDASSAPSRIRTRRRSRTGSALHLPALTGRPFS